MDVRQKLLHLKSTLEFNGWSIESTYETKDLMLLCRGRLIWNITNAKTRQQETIQFKIYEHPGHLSNINDIEECYLETDSMTRLEFDSKDDGKWDSRVHEFMKLVIRQ